MAVAQQPSLAASIQQRLAKFGLRRPQVRGANGSFRSSESALLDDQGHIDIAAADDPKLTAPDKLEYVEAGTDPKGVMSAALECWGRDRKRTMGVLELRLKTRHQDKSWRERVICSVVQLVVERPEDAAFLQKAIEIAGVLAGLNKRVSCSVKHLVEHVPTACRPRIFEHLAGSETWADEGYDFVPAVIFQTWIAQDQGVMPAFLEFLDKSAFVARDARAFFDLAHLQPLLPQLLAKPTPRTAPPRGMFLLAVLFLNARKAAAPELVKAYIKTLVGEGERAFPPGCNYMLAGINEQSLLEHAGVIPREDAPVPDTAPPNLALRGSGENDVTVRSVTRRGTANKDANVYLLPYGNVVGTIASGTPLHVIGTLSHAVTEAPARINQGQTPGTQLPMLAIEHQVFTVKTTFVKAADLDLQ